MRLAIGTALLFSFVTSQLCSAQSLLPPTPYLDHGACPFECCTYRRWTVEKDTVIYRQRSTSAGVAFRLKRGDHVTGVTGVVVTLKPGPVIVKKARTIGEDRKVRVKPGDILYLLHYSGEGIYKLWFRGRTYEAEMPTAPGLITNEPLEQREEFLHVESEPNYVWWVKVKNRRGQTGWTKENDNFGNMDACG
ncbi:MAG TPA: hypothetical protein VE961_24385 [Pyrinomonadaceae bacterium]|nr:hypothetical protein [Pyrinomonadaceae bacterium]